MKILLTIAVVAMIALLGADVRDGTCVDDLDCVSGDYCDAGYCATTDGIVVIDPVQGAGNATVTPQGSCSVSSVAIGSSAPSAIFAALLLLFFLVAYRFRRRVGAHAIRKAQSELRGAEPRARR